MKKNEKKKVEEKNTINMPLVCIYIGIILFVVIMLVFLLTEYAFK